MPEGQYVKTGWVSMGEGRQLKPYGTCEKSPDGMHHYRCIECIQSNEKFVCEFCHDWYID